MATPLSGSAKIYTFPPRGRFALKSGGGVIAAAPAADVELPPGAEFVSAGGSWYHDEAIADAVKATQSRKN